MPESGKTLTADSKVKSPGGKAANQVVAAARLGTSTRLVAATGNGQPGRDGLVSSHQPTS
ncbi:PfkB family carbohydrate kinase [Brachybacterium alimentarium]|uniref:PfkB family carbohydrate kinase n=1 Tax=Brachybacterium alimentarium TaxID=47845 RepID=UPI003FD653CB